MLLDHKEPIMRQIRWDGPLYLPVKQDPLCNLQHYSARIIWNQSHHTHHPFGIKKSWNKGILCTEAIAAASSLRRPCITPRYLFFSLTAERFSSFLSLGVRGSLTEKDWKSHFCPRASDPQPKLTLPSAVGISLRQAWQTNVPLLEIQLSLSKEWRRSEEALRGWQWWDHCFLVMSLLEFSHAALAEKLLAHMWDHRHAAWFLRSSVSRSNLTPCYSIFFTSLSHTSSRKKGFPRLLTVCNWNVYCSTLN